MKCSKISAFGFSIFLLLALGRSAAALAFPSAKTYLDTLPTRARKESTNILISEALQKLKVKDLGGRYYLFHSKYWNVASNQKPVAYGEPAGGGSYLVVGPQGSVLCRITAGYGKSNTLGVAKLEDMSRANVSINMKRVMAPFQEDAARRRGETAALRRWAAGEMAADEKLRTGASQTNFDPKRISVKVDSTYFGHDEITAKFRMGFDESANAYPVRVFEGARDRTFTKGEYGKPPQVSERYGRLHETGYEEIGNRSPEIVPQRSRMEALRRAGLRVWNGLRRR
jgi:hypothetical protein